VELDRQQVENALEALPDDEREVIKTLFFNGKSIAAACDELAYSERTIRRKTATALNTLALAI
jgi:RNA polymerase sigma factor (sigma-70 family)